MNENFSEYCHNIIIKASEIGIPEDKISGYIIDGVTDFQLQNARMQNFPSTSALLQAFKKISFCSEAKHFKKQDDKMGLETKTSRVKEEDRNDYVPGNMLVILIAISLGI